MERVIRVNTKLGTVTVEDFKAPYTGFGNRGLIAKVLEQEVDPTCDPLGPGNKFIMSTGLLAGTNATTAHRLSVGCKSPMTGGAKESNSGGLVAYYMSRHGIKMIIFEDAPDTNDENAWKILKINADGTPVLIDATKYVGMNNYELSEVLHEEFGEDIVTASIGVAGERLNKAASVQCTDFACGHPARAAARGGIGAVMGSKKIKALILEKASAPYKVEIKDKARYTAALKKLATNMNNPGVAGFKQGGTTGNIAIQCPGGIIPVRSFSGDYIGDENLEPITRDKWIDRVNKYGGKQGCACQPGCLIQCSNIYCAEDGEFITSALEYETAALCGPNLHIYNFDFMARMDRFCDDYGIDTVDFGAAVGVLMDEGKIPWGDMDAVYQLCQEIYEGSTEYGKLVPEGVYVLGTAIGAKRIPACKKQALAGYDPRNMKGTGVTYATTTQGADHTAGLVPMGDPLSKEGQVEASRGSQLMQCANDNINCSFAFGMAGDFTIWTEMLSAVYGEEWDMDRLMQLGIVTFKMEREFNAKAGLTAADDTMPKFMREEVSSCTGSVFDISDEELQEVFNF